MDSLALTVAPDGNVYCKVIEKCLDLYIDFFKDFNSFFQNFLRYAIRQNLRPNVLKLSLIQVKFLPTMTRKVAQDVVERYY